MTRKNPLAEVFGFSVDDFSKEANRHRKTRLCPYNNKVPSCTKDKANDPLGVCSIFEGPGEEIAITCPIRFRQDWLIAEHAASFFFSERTNWTSLTEVRLSDKSGASAGNIDIVLVSYDNRGKVLDFGSLEVQAVYISGNTRRPFQAYIRNPSRKHNMDWASHKNYPRPDYLSSSRKRLLPQLIYKGGILKTWEKKMAVAIHKGFYQTLPNLSAVEKQHAELAWLVYDLERNVSSNKLQLRKLETKYTLFEPALEKIVTPNPGRVEDFIQLLQDKLDEKLVEIPPDTHTLQDMIEEE